MQKPKFFLQSMLFLIVFSCQSFCDNINTQEYFPDSRFRVAVEDFMGVNHDEPFSIEQAAQKIGELSCANKLIENVSGIEYFPNITGLNISENRIQNLNLSHNIELKNLYCDRNLISSINLSNATKIEIIHCYNNQLNQLLLPNHKYIREIESGNNKINAVFIPYPQKLRVFNLKNNQISDLKGIFNPEDLLESCIIDLSLNRLSCNDWNIIYRIRSRISNGIAFLEQQSGNSFQRCLNTIPYSGFLNEYTKWSGEILLTGDVIVNNILEVAPGTKILSLPLEDDQDIGENKSRVEIIVDNGQFLAHGTDSQPILLSSFSESPKPSEWYGIISRSDNLSLQHCIIEYAKQGITLNGLTQIFKNVTIRKNSDNGLLLFPGYYGETIQACSFSENAGHGILANGVTFSISNCIFSKNKGDGVRASDYYDANGERLYSKANITNSTVAESMGNGITGLWSPVKVAGSTVKNNFGEAGIYVYAQDLEVTNSQVKNNTNHGIRGFSNTKITNSHVSNNKDGVFGLNLSLSDSIVSQNNNYGVSFEHVLKPGIFNNLIDRNLIGVLCISNDIEALTLSNNDILLNTQYEIKNSGRSDVLSKGNYFGYPSIQELSENKRNLSKIYDWNDNNESGLVILEDTHEEPIIATHTPTFTPTNTYTPTPSPTITPTFTPTYTITPSSTPTNTYTSTPSPTPSPTDTNTPSITPTYTFTPTPSQTFTVTVTPSITSTWTYTLTYTPSITPSHSATPSFSPIITLKPTINVTPTIPRTYNNYDIIEWVKNESNGHYYGITKAPVTWEEAKTLSNSYKSNMLIINDETENDWIHNKFLINRGILFWLGVLYDVSKMEWVTVNHEVLAYQNWDFDANQSPSDSQKYYAGINSNGKWLPLLNNIKLYAILESDEEFKWEDIYEGTMIKGINAFITDNTVWSKEDSPFIVEDDILISERATLTIESGVQIFFKGHYSLYIQGAIKAIGSELEHITFDMQGSNFPFLHWGSINIQSFSEAEFNWCEIRNANTGLTLKEGSNYKISNCTITNCFKDGISSRSGWISNSTIENCQITKNGDSGIWVYSTSMTINGCIISCNKNLGVGGSFRSSSLIKNSIIENNTIAIDIDLFDSSIRNSIIKDNISGGIVLNGINATIEICNFHNNGNVGIQIEHGNTININRCNIIEQGFSIENLSPSVINATKNYWGEQVTTEIKEKGVSSNITSIFDTFDDNGKGRIFYNDYLVFPANITIDLIFTPTPTSTFTPTPNPFDTPTNTPTPTYTPTPTNTRRQTRTPTPIVYPTVSEPTPVFNISIDNESIDSNNIWLIEGTFASLNHALVTVTDILPSGASLIGAEGNALRVSVKPGEGSLILFGRTPIPTNKKALVRATVWSNNQFPSVITGLIDTDQNGNLSGDGIGMDQLNVSRKINKIWSRITSLHDSQTGYVLPFVQVTGGFGNSDVYIDNVEVYVLDENVNYSGRFLGVQ